MTKRTLGDRVTFYLSHRQRIKEWAKLGSEVGGEAHDFYCSLAEPMDTAASNLPGNPRVFAYLERDHAPKILLIRTEWAGANDGEHPRLGIGIQWPKTECRFTNAQSGVWVNRRPGHKTFGDRLSPLVANHAEKVWETGGHRPAGPAYKLQSAGGGWPLRRDERPHQQDYWTDLDGYALALVERVCSLWETMFEPVQAAFVEANGKKIE